MEPAAMLCSTSGRLAEMMAVREPLPMPLLFSAWISWLVFSRTSL
jgi:hypothetical protein